VTVQLTHRTERMSSSHYVQRPVNGATSCQTRAPLPPGLVERPTAPWLRQTLPGADCAASLTSSWPRGTLQAIRIFNLGSLAHSCIATPTRAEKTAMV